MVNFKWPASKMKPESKALNSEELQDLLTELKNTETGAVIACSRGDSKQVMLADHYEILALDKAAAKKLTSEDLQSLVAYGQNYMEEYRDGRFMFKPGPEGRSMADLDEAGIFNEMLLIVGVLKAELNRRV
jgi:hypothetical protein